MMTLLVANEGDSWQTIIPVISAAVAAGAAVLVAIISVWWQRSARKEDAEAGRRHQAAAFHRRQLDELYGEMYLLRSTSRRMWSRLHQTGTDFRLVDNIVEIKEEDSSRRRETVADILAINDRLAVLIETRASLLAEFPPPESFLAFLDHHRVIRSLWNMGENARGEEPSFPRDLDADIERSILHIKARLQELDG